jgi:hypothetical protein
MDKNTFILHDETVNTYGFRMLTDGANLEEFRKNPVMLLNHNDYSLPIGRWENIRVVGTQILADAVLDMKDTTAKIVAQKIADDFIRMASIGAWSPEEKSDAYNLKLPGQTLPTVTKWTVREASIVTIGANHNALVFYDRKTEKVIDLTDKENLIRLMDSNKQLKTSKMNSLLTSALKLSDNATEADIFSAVQLVLSDNDRLRKENATLVEAHDQQVAAKKAAQTAEAIELVDAAIKDGRCDAGGKDAFLKLFDANFAETKAVLANLPKRASVTSQMGVSKGSVNLGDLKDKSWEELDKAGKLLQLKDNQPELYAAKFKERFGTEPKM